MQEEIERRTIAVSLTAGKLTARTLARALAAALRQIRQQRRAALTPQGRQSVKKLMNHGVNTSRIPLDGSTRLFDRVARKYNVDYAFRKVGPKQYRLFFKAGQADAITDCFAEYTKRMMKKERRPSVLKRLGRANEAVARQRPRRETGAPEKSQDFLGRGGAREQTQFSPRGVNEVKRTLRRRGEAVHDR